MAAKLATMNPADAINKFQDLRIAYYKTLGTFARYGAGWTRRTNEIREIALKM